MPNQQNPHHLALNALFLLSFMIFTVLLSVAKQALMYALSLELSPHFYYSTLPAAFVLSMGLDWFIANKTWRLKPYLWLLGLIVVLVGLAKNIDIFHPWDGIAYHEPAMYVQYLQQNLLFAPVEQMHYWSHKYPKFSWIFSGELAVLLGRLGALSSYSLLLGAALLLFSLYFCTLFDVSRYRRYLFALLIIFTPIGISQLFTTYVDSSMAYLVCLLFFAAVAISRKQDRYAKYVLVFAASIMINLKFSGFLYVAVAFFYLGLWHLRSRQLIGVFGLFGLFLLIGVGILGFNPYIKNLQQGQHIFHPLFGEEKLDIMSFNTPTVLQNKSPLEKLLYSNFSRTSNDLHLEKALKSPLSVRQSEFAQAAVTVDVRLGGFGPLYPLALLLTLLILALSLRKNRHDIRYDLLFLIVLSTLPNPEAWWARYNSPLYLLVLLPLLSPVFVQATRRQRLSTYLMYLLVALLTLQTLALSVIKIKHTHTTYQTVKTQFLRINSPNYYIPANGQAIVDNEYDYLQAPFYAKYAPQASTYDTEHYVCAEPKVIPYAMLNIGYCDQPPVPKTPTEARHD